MIIMETVKFFSNLIKATFLSRPNRFIVECTVQDKPVRAYLPNPGRLWELFFPGTVLYLTKQNGSKAGKTEYTVVAVKRDDIPIMLHTHVNNLVARTLIEQGNITGLENATIVRSEVTIGHSRFDFQLKQGEKDVIVEVKSCTLFGNRIAMFPDAVTARGTRHLQELADLSRKGMKTAVLFIIHWPKADYFMPDYHTDLAFSRTLLAVKNDVMIRALSVGWSRDLTLESCRETQIPWNVIEQESLDRGSYLVILRVRNDCRLSINGLGEVRFRKGYYVYVDSAKKDLSKQIEHQRRRCKICRHAIDQLRTAAEFHTAIAVRSSEHLACDIADVLSVVTDWQISGFGSADCNCQGHLFGMTSDPVHNRSFVKVLQYFRIDRLDNYLELSPARE